MRNSLKALLACAFLTAAVSSLPAQDVVHAIPGTLASLDPATGSLTLKTESGAPATFTYKAGVMASNVKAGDHVIVSYIGDSEGLRVVSVRDLGSNVSSLSGTITRVDKGKHAITIQTPSGEQVCYISKDAAVDMTDGVVDGANYTATAQKGDKVSVDYTNEAGKKTVQFVEPS